MKKLTLLLGLAVLGSCSSNEKTDSLPSGAKIITKNDFESLAGWGVDPAYLDRGRAHSGQYAIKVDQNREFSLTFDMELGQASPTKFKVVHLDAWAYLPSDRATGMLSLQVVDASNGQQVFNHGILLGEIVKSHSEWVPINQDITLPDNITATQHLRLYLWRAGASDYVLIDDVTLSIKE